MLFKLLAGASLLVSTAAAGPGFSTTAAIYAVKQAMNAVSTLVVNSPGGETLLSVPVFPSTIDDTRFPNTCVGSSQSVVFTVTNPPASTITASATGAFTTAVNSNKVTVTFTPTKAEQHSGMITINDFTFEVAGAGKDASFVVEEMFTPNEPYYTIDYGEIGTPGIGLFSFRVAKQFKVRNNGLQCSGTVTALKVLSQTLNGDAITTAGLGFSGQGIMVPITLAAGAASNTLTVFLAVAGSGDLNYGSYIGDLAIMSGTNQLTSVHLKAQNGVAAVVVPVDPDAKTCTGDFVIPGGEWHESGTNGAKYNCAYYESNKAECLTYGVKNANFGFTAVQACCSCDGGLKEGEMQPVVEDKCVDVVGPAGELWMELDIVTALKSIYTCAYYATQLQECATYGVVALSAAYGHTASTACCVCKAHLSQ